MYYFLLENEILVVKNLFARVVSYIGGRGTFNFHSKPVQLMAEKLKRIVTR